MIRSSLFQSRVGLHLAAVAAMVLVAASTARAQSGPFQEQGGLVVVEIESSPVAGSWVAETDHAGFTGQSYYRWDGPNSFGVGGKGVLAYDVEIHTGGDYLLKFHNRHEHADSSLENDAWLRVDGGPWHKCYSNKGASTVKKWNWHTVLEIGTQKTPPKYNFAPGVHRVEFSGRSANFMIDRFHLHVPSHPDATNVNVPESPTTLGGVQNYCTPKQASNGCVPTMSADGEPRAGGSSSFLVSGRNVIADKAGLLFYGFEPASTPFKGGTLCISGALKRLPAQDAGGNSGDPCSGRIRVDFGALAQSSFDPRFVPGETTYVQCWFRDGPSSFGIGLSDGLRFTWMP
jgi:hypothetical protein